MKGAKINIPDSKGRSPIYFACKFGNMDALEFLLNKRISPTVTDNRLRAPIHVAILKGWQNGFKKLWNLNPTHILKDIEGNTPLHYAVKARQSDIAKFIVGKDTSMIMMLNKKGETPLDLAVQLKQTDLVFFFTQNGGKKRS